MNVWIIVIISVVGLFLLYKLIASWSFSSQKNKLDKYHPKQTTITAVYSQPMINGTNLLYCSTMQLAWNEFIKYAKQNGKQMPAHQPSCPLADYLNKQEFLENDLHSDCYLAAFGGNEIIDYIKQEMQRRFNDQPKLDLRPLKEREYLFYAYLKKLCQFENPFHVLQHKLSFRGVPVSAFGVTDKNTDAIRKQVSICDYKSDNDFIVSLKTKSQYDDLILCKIPTSSMTNLSDVIQHCSSRIGQRVEEMEEEDTLIVPKLKLDVHTSYEELNGLNFPDIKTVIIENRQLIQFELNETGASLRSEAMMVALRNCASSSKPKHMIFDGPFLLMMREKHSRKPYFALWIENTEFMEKESI